MREETAPERWLRRLRLSGFGVIALGLLILAVVVLAPSLRILVEQQQQVAQLRQQVTASQSNVDELTAQLARWQDPAYIEAQARQRLIFVYPGEKTFLVIGAAKPDTNYDPQPISAQLQTTKTDWVAALVSATYAAGFASVDADEIPQTGQPLSAAVLPGDLEVMAAQLGRPVRGVVAVAARCVCGRPTVVSTRPRLADGAPFPTFFYLTHPAATASVSRLEAEGSMRVYEAMLGADPVLADQYAAAHDAYLAAREAYGEVAEIAGISAGGMPTRVKCLHALVAHSLAAGPGLNPIGDLALAECDWSPLVCQCIV